MGKASRGQKAKKTVATVPPVSATKRGVPWFPLSMAGVVLLGGATVGVLASQRVSTANIEPRALLDHWHDAFSVYSCNTFLPPNASPDHGDGIHGHGDGLIHIHPTNSNASGPKATLGEYLETVGASLTDARYEPGPGEGGLILDEAAGCGGKPATLKLAVWPFDDLDSTPRIIETGLADYLFEQDGEVLTLALVPAGAEVPQNPNSGNVAEPGDVP